MGLTRSSMLSETVGGLQELQAIKPELQGIASGYRSLPNRVRLKLTIDEIYGRPWGIYVFRL